MWCGGHPYFSNFVSVEDAQAMIKTNTLKIYNYQAWTPTAGTNHRAAQVCSLILFKIIKSLAPCTVSFIDSLTRRPVANWPWGPPLALPLKVLSDIFREACAFPLGARPILVEGWLLDKSTWAYLLHHLVSYIFSLLISPCVEQLTQSKTRVVIQKIAHPVKF